MPRTSSARPREKHLAWTDALVPELASRIGPDAPDADLRAHTMINTAPGCFDVALVRWLEAGADLSLAGLVDDVFGFVRIPHA
ncbi:hypothetical protein [Streptomyces sp. NRRL S-1896]|uniref:hypothetical protein n=1 Tax=Streptomyces sp. NRRL S-1896 TaxID=1463893 RepID=UPI001F3D28B1|nr:hypothetical protein [Streptomyces sp. NRRL S-1896]